MTVSRQPRLAEIEPLLAGQKFAVLATENDLQPYCNFIAYSLADDLTAMFFATPRNTSKYRNLKKNGRVSLLLDSRSGAGPDSGEITAVTVVGQAMEVAGAEEDVCRSRHIQAHPAFATFFRDPDCALFQIAVEKYIVVNGVDRVSELVLR